MKLFWQCTLGDKSHMNIVGKVLFFPVILLMFVIIFLLDRLFTKPEHRLLD